MTFDRYFPFFLSGQPVVIREKCPTIEGLFIISAKETSCKTLREVLDSREDVDIKDHSVHEVVWILKVGKLLESSTFRISLSLHEQFSSS